MGRLYEIKPIIIWIDTPKEVAKSRIKDDVMRYSRQENENFSAIADFIFEPTGHLPKDKKNFIVLIKTIANTM